MTFCSEIWLKILHNLQPFQQKVLLANAIVKPSTMTLDSIWEIYPFYN